MARRIIIIFFLGIIVFSFLGYFNLTKAQVLDVVSPIPNLQEQAACNQSESLIDGTQPIAVYLAIDESLSTRNDHDRPDYSGQTRRYQLAQMIANYLFARSEVSRVDSYLAVYRFDEKEIEQLTFSETHPSLPIKITGDTIKDVNSKLVPLETELENVETILSPATYLLTEIKSKNPGTAQPVVFIISDGWPIPKNEAPSLEGRLTLWRAEWEKTASENNLENIPVYTFLLDFIQKADQDIPSHTEISAIWRDVFYKNKDEPEAVKLTGHIFDVPNGLSQAIDALLQDMEDVSALQPPLNSKWQIENFKSADDTEFPVPVDRGLEVMQIYLLVPENGPKKPYLSHPQDEEISFDSVDGTNDMVFYKVIDDPDSGDWKVIRETNALDHQPIVFISQLEYGVEARISPAIPIVGQPADVEIRLLPKSDVDPTFEIKLTGDGFEKIVTNFEYIPKDGITYGHTQLPMDEMEANDYLLTITALRNGKAPIERNCNLYIAKVPNLVGTPPKLVANGWKVELSISDANLIESPFALDVYLVDGNGREEKYESYTEIVFDVSDGSWKTPNPLEIPYTYVGKQVLARLTSPTNEGVVVINDEWMSGVLQLPTPTPTPTPIPSPTPTPMPQVCSTEPKTSFALWVGVLNLIFVVVSWLFWPIIFHDRSEAKFPRWIFILAFINISGIAFYASTFILQLMDILAVYWAWILGTLWVINGLISALFFVDIVKKIIRAIPGVRQQPAETLQDETKSSTEEHLPSIQNKFKNSNTTGSPPSQTKEYKPDYPFWYVIAWILFLVAMQLWVFLYYCNLQIILNNLLG